MHLGPITLRLERAHERHRRGRSARVVALVSVVSMLVLAGAPSAGAATNPHASTVGNIAVAVRSVTVSPTRFQFTCSGPNGALEFPRDSCDPPQLTITNGAATADIDVSVSNAVPTDGGTPWAECGGASDEVCTGASMGGSDHFPGPDQFSWYRYNSNYVSHTPTPLNGLTSKPGDVITEFGGGSWFVIGPQSSTDPSVNWKVTLTFWAMPAS